MRRNLVTMRYFETYYYANVIDNVLSEPFAYLRHMNSWHEDREATAFLNPFSRRSVLHDFAEHVIRLLMDQQISDVNADSMVHDKSAELWVDQALRYHGLATDGFRNWLTEQNVSLSDVNEDHIADYHTELHLSGDLEELIEQQAAEVFFVLFGNRVLLAKLNEYVAGVVVNMGPAYSSNGGEGPFAADGRLKRAHIPEWAKNAVFFRDRGMCVQCLANLSGLLTAQNDDNFDHIIPLKEGGINDITNLQLLCGTCNKKKGGRRADVPNRYESWF